MGQTALWRKAVLAALAVLMLWVAFRVRGVLAIIALALVLAYFLEPVVAFFQRHRFSRAGAIVSVYALLALAAALVLLVGLPQLAQQLAGLETLIPHYAAQIQSLAAFLQGQAERFALPSVLDGALEAAFSSVQAAILQSAAAWGEALVGAAGSLLDIFLIPVLTFYLLKDKEELLRQMWRVLPLGWHGDLERLGRQINQLLRDFLLGNVIVSAIVAAIVTAGLSIIGMDFALVCGLVVGALNIVPYFGAVIGAIPAIVIAMFTSIQQVIAVVVVMVIAQQLESDVITPKIIGERIGVHPVAVILGVLVWGKLWGVWGVLLAVPATAIVKILLAFALDKLISPQARR